MHNIPIIMQAIRSTQFSVNLEKAVKPWQFERLCNRDKYIEGG